MRFDVFFLHIFSQKTLAFSKTAMYNNAVLIQKKKQRSCNS